MDVQVSAATRGDVPVCARVVAAALRDDAVVRAMVPGDHDRLGRLTTVYRAVLREAVTGGGVVDVARDDPGGPVLGVAVWEPPGAPGGSMPLRELLRLVRAVGLRNVRATTRALRTFADHRPRDPHWLLADLAAAPHARGRGVGSALLAHRLATVDVVGLPAYLEATTDASRRLYERFGFRATGTIQLPGAVATSMVRQPARPA